MRCSIQQACRLLNEGDIVAIPTDTVYGIAASMMRQNAIEKVFQIKGRPPEKPLIIQVAHYQDVLPYLSFVPPDFERLTKMFWPGALTLVVPVKTMLIPNIVRSGLFTAGFRIPNHPQTLEILKNAGPLVVPSANPTELPSATNPQQVESYFGNNFPVVDGAECLHGQASTILEFKENGWKVIREGVISNNAIFDFLK